MTSAADAPLRSRSLRALIAIERGARASAANLRSPAARTPITGEPDAPITQPPAKPPAAARRSLHPPRRSNGNAP